MSVARGALAVVGGIAVFTLALLALDAAGTTLLGAESWINRSTATQVAWLCGNAVCMIAGGFVAARLAPRARVAHALLVGAIQTGLTLAAFVTLNGGTTPTWLWLAGMLLTVPAAWVGGRLAVTRGEKPERASAA
jgi:hypothetical protein